MRNHRRRRMGPVPANVGPLLAILLAFTLSASAAGPSTRANDDSCDIALLPAATLLLPYFEVDFTDVTNQVTLFTVTNVTHVSQIARVTLWTDFSYPVLTFNIYLTGYDTQSISLFDVIARGIIGNGTGTAKSHVGAYSDPNNQLDETSCANLPGSIDAAFVARMQDAFREGRAIGSCEEIGGVHENAVGYATIDVVGNCSTANPADAEYFTNDIRFDNVLIGDYQQISGKFRTYAEVSPMVHIRAIPEGGTPTSRVDAGEVFESRFPNTFYGRFQNPLTPNADARQPLPSRFALRWINDGAGAYETRLKVWRQSATGRNIDCGRVDDNSVVRVRDAVLFDPDENGEGTFVPICQITCVGDPHIVLPSTALIQVAPGSDVFPHALLSAGISGWLYFDLDDDNLENGSHQNWVVVSMFAGNTFGGDMDATALGNGCSPPIGLAEESETGSAVIGPAENGEP
ncbi:MAG: hypothetical protein ACJ74H_10525 [Thermoanaerobaculia bacterium]